MSEGFTIYGPPLRGRSCGSCKACCTIVPVELPTGNKAANVRCPHLYSRGCSIYATRPRPCVLWSCRFLFDPLAVGLRRPDQSGYIVDAMLDTVMANGQPIEALQLWIDPARPDAHRAPELRAYLAEIGRIFGLPTIARWNSSDGFLLLPPFMNTEGEWLEIGGALVDQADLNARIVASGNPHLQRRLEARPRP